MSAEAKKRGVVKINDLECKSCGRCVISCPVKVLEIGQTLNARGYHSGVYKGAGCRGCCNCYYSCPQPLAIEVR